MKKTLFAAGVGLGLSVSAAHAYDWSVDSFLSQSVELNDNQFLAPTPLGTVGSYSYLKTNVLTQTPTSKFFLDGDIRYSRYFGPGAENTPLDETTSSGVHARFEDYFKNSSDKNYLDVSWRHESTAIALLNTIGIATNANGFIDTTSATGGIERALSAYDFVTLSSHGTTIDYDPSSGGTHYTDVGAVGTWKRQIDTRSSVSVSSEVQWLNYNNANNTDVVILRETAGFQSQITPLLSFDGNAGIALLDTQQHGTAITPIQSSSLFGGGSGTAEGFIGSALLTYKMLKTTVLSVYARQTIGPTITGSLTQNASYGTTLTHTINSLSNISFNGDVTRQALQNFANYNYSASISYSYQFTKDWSTQISYRFLYRTPSTGTNTSGTIFDPLTGLPIATNTNQSAISNSILLVLTRNFTELPRGR